MVFDYPTNVTSFYDLVRYDNGITGGYLGSLMLLAIFIVGYMAMAAYPIERRFAASSFITFIVCVGFSILQIVPGFYIMITASAVALSGFMLIRSGTS
jgi:hypothetical protein